MSRSIVIAAGGTGGHMFPALALARALGERGERPVLVCDARGARYVGTEVEHRVIRAASPSGAVTARLGAMLRLGQGFAQALLILRRLRPAAVAAFGGYASVPVALAAQLLRVPVLVHEQNAVLGRANRLIARRAAGLALTFAETAGAEAIPAARRMVTGNPVRTEIARRCGQVYEVPRPDQPFRLLVVGGSQGARVFSDVLPGALALLSPQLRGRMQLTQQCRPEDLDRVADAYAEIGFEAELKAFFEDLPERLARAHLVVSRSGASSVAELVALGRPAILVPFRLAADDHQRANAEVLTAAGAAQLIAEAELTPERLASALDTLLAQPEQLAAMARRARALAGDDAARALADAVQALAHGSPAAQSNEALA